MQTSLKTRALQTFAAGPFMLLGTHLNHSIRVQPESRESHSLQEGATASTWQPDPALHFALHCVEDKLDGESVQLLHDLDTDSFYYLRRECWVQQCPCDTVLLAHYVEDRCDGGVRPTLLVFDAATLAGESMRGVQPTARYARLRELAVHFNAAFMTLQWVGDFQAMHSFLQQAARQPIVPHDIRNPIVLTSDPLRPLQPHSDSWRGGSAEQTTACSSVHK
eukprot:1880823-Rhodomonas_salina.1